jgi:hypothetical protein
LTIQELMSDANWSKLSPAQKGEQVDGWLAADPDWSKLSVADQAELRRRAYAKAGLPAPTAVPSDWELVEAGHAERAKEAWENMELYAFLVAALLSIPRAWYFLLGRIAELRAVIKGG